MDLLSKTTAHPVIAITAFLCIYWFLWVAYARLFHPLSRYPGPFLASISRSWLILDVASGKCDKTQRALHSRYGPIVRIAPNELSVSDPEAMKVIYGTHSNFVKTDFYLPFRVNFGRYPDHFTNLDERQHAERRRIVNSLYSMSSIIQMEESMDQCCEQLISSLSKFADNGQIFDLADWSQWYAFDVIGTLFFSRMFGFMKNAHDYRGYISALRLLVPLLAVALVMPSYMRPVYLFSGAMVPRVFKALKALNYIEKESEACVAERQTLLAGKPEDKPEDMLQGFFGIMHKKGEQKNFGLGEIQLETYGAFIAGSDTTAASITGILYYLMKSPAAYRRLTAEIDEATQAGTLSPTVQYHEAVGLPYLSACIKEGMRLHPSVGMMMPRQVPRGGCIFGDRWFPAGTRLGMNAAVVQRDSGIFGEHSNDFIPERWLRKDSARMERYMLHFGAGTRTCLGKNISLCEIYKVIPQLVRTFNIELNKQDLEWETYNYWFNRPSKVYVSLSHREVRAGTP